MPPLISSFSLSAKSTPGRVAAPCSWASTARGQEILTEHRYGMYPTSNQRDPCPPTWVPMLIVRDQERLPGVFTKRSNRCAFAPDDVVARAGFEPATSGL